MPEAGRAESSSTNSIDLSKNCIGFYTWPSYKIKVNKRQPSCMCDTLDDRIHKKAGGTVL